MPKVNGSRRVSRIKRQALVPYARGFRRPTLDQQQKATGADAKEYVTGEGFFEPVPRCTSENDWLAQYVEKPQSYRDYLCQCPWISRRKVKNYKSTFIPEGRNISEKYPKSAIYILPLGDMSASKNCPDMSTLAEYTSIFYDLPVRILSKVELVFEKQAVYWAQEKDGVEKRHFLNSRFNQKTGHWQLRVDSGLKRLKHYMPDDALCLIALTMCDLYEDDTDIFVAGMASGNNGVAIFSLFRYDPIYSFSGEFWYEFNKSAKLDREKRKRLLLQRSSRLLVHELGHLLGLGHCIYYSCIMNGSGHLAEDFRQAMFLCPVDLHKVQTLCGLNVPSRYSLLKDFYRKHGLLDEANWIDKRLDYISGEKIIEPSAC